MPPTGRYQSRVLSFLFQRSRQWVDQCEVALRHAKVATLWGVQVLLSPLYLIRQGGWRRFGQPLGGGPVAAAGLPEAGEVPPPSSALSPDEGPVLEVLQVVEQWRSLSATSSLPPADGALVAGSSGAIAPQGVAVRGIASCLVSRQLVLVNADNQGLEGLTPFEQRLLKQQIWLAIALFESRQWVRPRLQGAAAALQGALRPLGQQVSRWAVGRLGGAVPMGAIAPQEVSERPELAASSGAIAPAAQPEDWLERTGKAALLIRQHLTKAIAGVLTLRRPAVGADLALPAPESQRSHQLSQNSPPPESGSLKSFGAIAPYGGLSRGPAAAVASLLQAAVAYFFGDRPPQPQLPAALPDLPASPPPKPLLGRVWQAIAPSAFGPEQVPTLTVDDPWLTAEDLFGAQPPVEHQPATADPVPQALPSAPRLSLPSSIRHWLRRIALNSTDLALPPDSPSPSPQIQSQPQNWGRWLVPRSQSSSKASSASLPVVAAPAGIDAPAPPRSEPAASGSFEHWLAALDDLGLTPNPDWIEASATPSGYVKHPLETLLDWFDRLLLWIEERVIAGFRWLSRFWKP